MCNCWGKSRLCCNGGRPAPCRCTAASATPAAQGTFEHIYRHHRRYRITEGSEEIQMRKVAAFLFGYLGPRRKELSEITWDDVDYRKRPY